MKIMLVGGGSGGHLTPLVAIAEEIKRRDQKHSVVYVGQRYEDLQEIVQHEAINDHYTVSAGKFRRYHGESWLRHLLDVKTIMLNARDFTRFLRGLVGAYRLLKRVRPDAIFLKGGFVCVPVAYAAYRLRIPYITHDSDAIPGLANRMSSKHATYNTTSMPVELYPYPKRKTLQVGIPLQSSFKKVLPADRAHAKESLGYKPTDKVLLSVGGGLGAQRLNQALAKATPDVLARIKDLKIVHLTGKKLYQKTVKMYDDTLSPQMRARVTCIDFSKELYALSAAADVVLSRAGATNIAELSTQAKACIVVPSPVLTGGQQLHNAKVLQDQKAAIVLQEENLTSLSDVLVELLQSSEAERKKLGDRLESLLVRGSAAKITDTLLEVAVQRQQQVDKK